MLCGYCTVVADRHVTGLEPRFTLVLPVDAFTLELQVQEMNLGPVSRYLGAAVTDNLRVGKNLGDAHGAVGRARKLADEVGNTARTRH
jgi:hypothetical protein